MNLGLNIFGWLLFLIGIGASIALHEVGHLVPAKRFGVKVTEYMIGFGPSLWSTVRGETRYGVKAIPLAQGWSSSYGCASGRWPAMLGPIVVVEPWLLSS